MAKPKEKRPKRARSTRSEIPPPRALKLVGEESVANGTHRLTMQQIDKIVRETRKQIKQRRLDTGSIRRTV